MVEIAYNIFEDDFDKSQIHTYNLSVLLGTDRLSYLVSNTENKVLGLRTYLFGNGLNPIQDILKEDTIFNANFNEIKVGVFSPQITLVPEELFIEEEAAIYLEKVVELKRKDTIFFNSIASLKMKGVFGFDQTPINELREAFPKVEIEHVSMGLIQNFVSNFDPTTQNVFINIYGNSVSITVVEKGALKFHNIFTFKASADCLYFVLLVYKQLNINPQKTPLYVVGELVENSEIHKLLYKYIKTIKFVEYPNFYTFGAAIKEALPSNFFFDLYSLKLCE